MSETTVDFSVVVPAYNAAEFLGESLPRLMSFLSVRFPEPRTWEVILVDDGSSDSTGREVSLRFPAVKVMAHARNLGKGAAVRTGMQAARGAFRFFIDADVSYDLDAFDTMLKLLTVKEFDVVIGQRSAGAADGEARPSLTRRIGGAVFTALVSRIVVTGVRDTQCGFKGFRAAAAEVLFGESVVDGFAFDVEILYYAFKRNYDVKRVPVRLRASGPSTVSLWRHGPVMLWEVVRLPFRYHWRRWRAQRRRKGPAS